ncbi:MAG: protein kinase [Pirellulaceae bacterium]
MQPRSLNHKSHAWPPAGPPEREIAMQPRCLNQVQLSDYLAGRVSDLAARQVEQHLQTCPRCQALAAGHQPHGDALLATARVAVMADSAEHEPELAVALATIGNFRSNSNPKLSTPAPATPDPSVSDPTIAVAPQIRSYRLLQKLGEGGMGTVYLAMHTRLEKMVALKIMKADSTANPQAISRFEREMRAIGRLDHPHIVRALDAGEERGVYFLVMEYVAGIDLDELVRSLGPLSVPEASELIRQAALGLAHAHEHNLVHRDVKPSNLMLAPEGQVKVLDLGLAQFQQQASEKLDLTLDGQMIGTLLYMSPEQLARSKSVDARADVYSLGVTLYCLLAGGLPLARGQSAAMLPGIQSLRDDVPAELRGLLHAMLAPAPNDRLQSMAQVAESLAPLAAGVDAAELWRASRKRPDDRAERPPTPPPVAASGRLAGSAVGRAGGGNTMDNPPLSIGSNDRRRWLLAAAIGTSAAALLAVGAWIGDLLNNDPPIPGPALASLIVAGDDPRLPQFLQDHAIWAIDAGGQAVRLRAGANELPPGSYQFVADHSDLKLGSTQMKFAARQSQRLEVGLPPVVEPSSQEPRLYATIPDAAGPMVHLTGSLWHAGLPIDKATPFTLTLRALDAEPAAGVPAERPADRWIEVEVVTQSPAGNYTETGLLLVEVAHYQRVRKLVVKEGWLTARSESISQRLAHQFPSEKLQQLTVEYDKSDTLAYRAQELQLYLPPERLSVQQVLLLLMDADVPTASPTMRTLRANLSAASGRVPSEETISGVLSQVVRSASAEDLPLASEGYELASSDEVPFGFVRLHVFSRQLVASCNYAHCDRTTLPSPPSKDERRAEAKLTASLAKQDPDPIAESSLPKDEGAWVSYVGKLERDSLPAITFRAELRMGGNELLKGAACRWLEVRAASTEPANAAAEEPTEHVEEALLLIEPPSAAGKFTIHEGWIRTSGQTFAFDPTGNVAAFEEGLLKLGVRLPRNRLSVHDLLTLLFAQDLKQSARLGKLRGNVQVFLVTTGSKREYVEGQFPIRGRPSILADLWTIPKKAGQPLDYTICRSRLVPFDFCTVNFHMSQPQRFELVTGLVDFKQAGAPPLFGGPLRLGDDAAKTALLLDKESDSNVRIWRDRNERPLEFAELIDTAEANDGTTYVVLRPVVLGSGAAKPQAESVDVPLLGVSEADRRWAKAGRVWALDGIQAHYIRTSSANKIRYVQRQGVGSQLLDAFPPLDQAWIKKIELERERLKRHGPKLRQ